MKNIVFILLISALFLSSCESCSKDVEGVSLKSGESFTARTYKKDIYFEVGDIITIKSERGGTIWFSLSNQNFSSADTLVDEGKNQFTRFIKIKVTSIKDR